MNLNRVEKKEIFTRFGSNEQDTGKTECQIALLSERIKRLTGHLTEHRKDHHSRRGLLMLVGQRRRLLNYLIKRDINRYRTVIQQLAIRR
jgi:small subunit ribosomal protein S15